MNLDHSFQRFAKGPSAKDSLQKNSAQGDFEDGHEGPSLFLALKYFCCFASHCRPLLTASLIAAAAACKFSVPVCPCGGLPH